MDLCQVITFCERSFTILDAWEQDYLFSWSVVRLTAEHLIRHIRRAVSISQNEWRDRVNFDIIEGITIGRASKEDILLAGAFDLPSRT